MLLMLSYGAAARTAEILTLDGRAHPRVLARRDAADITLHRRPSGPPVLVLRQAPGSSPLMECLGWSSGGGRLIGVRCR